MSKLMLKPHQWRNLIQNRHNPVYGAALKYACQQAGIGPREKSSEGATAPAATSRPASGRESVKKQIALLEGRLLGKRLFTGGTGPEIQALQCEIDSLKSQAATA